MIEMLRESFFQLAIGLLAVATVALAATLHRDLGRLDSAEVRLIAPADEVSAAGAAVESQRESQRTTLARRVRRRVFALLCVAAAMVPLAVAAAWSQRRRSREAVLNVRRRENLRAEIPEPVHVLDLDLGERDRLEQLDRHRQRLESLGTLASGIAHDLNNLLTPILMSSKMLQRDTPGVDREALLATISSGASRGAELIDQLLTFARGGEGGHSVIQPEKLLREVVTILQRTLTTEVRLTLELEEPLPRIAGDETEISQVVMNLAINARDAMPEGGELKITARRYHLASDHSFSFSTLPPGEYLRIQVSDCGSGIPAELQDRIFDPFFSTKERGHGTGLGLSTTLGIVKSHQGAIRVQSQLGSGTTLSVFLPALEPASPTSFDPNRT